LKVASIVTTIFAVGHTYGTLAILYGPSREQLEAQKVLVEGIPKTYADMFAGYGYLITTLLVMQAVMLWWIANQRKNRLNISMPVAFIAAVSGANGLIAHFFLIHIPAIFLSVIFGLLMFALYLIRGENAKNTSSK
jgi:hypothetical protein